eukprot:TRINITY_DN9290_c0_g1_i1.p1 TRINITY_DN9290_c0_g1~~TRINITY_DN9290_c0_g1_i1.p1  ORF type:complete len:511 (-),score=99.02 TRINITY_DN9290_c0_g1_i1:96-1628(-)
MLRSTRGSAGENDGDESASSSSSFKLSPSLSGRTLFQYFDREDGDSSNRNTPDPSASSIMSVLNAVRFGFILVFALQVVILAILIFGRSTTNDIHHIDVETDNCPSFIDTSNLTCPGVCSKVEHSKPRARDLGIPFDGLPGVYNAITDVPGVLVGHSTLICNDPGPHAVRTGVTAILPKGIGGDPVSAAFYSLSGNGELTGTHWIEESGCAVGPIMLTNTVSVGQVATAVNAYSIPIARQLPYFYYELPIVGETDDGYLNDIEGMHVKQEHVFQALDCAATGAVAEGNVGGGTGMMTFEFKAGIGTASRLVQDDSGKNWTVGVLVQSNHGAREDMLVAGAPIGREITDLIPLLHDEDSSSDDDSDNNDKKTKKKSKRALLDRKHREGSFLCIIGTDAPITPTSLYRIAKRAVLGYARAGGMGRTSSGDLFLAFSTGGTCTFETETPTQLRLSEFELNPFFYATVQAVEEAILNALVAAETMVGLNGNTVYALPQDRLQKLLKKYNRYSKP